MKFKKLHKQEQDRELSRRALLGWLTAAGAALAIPAWKVREIIEGTHGKAFAAASQAGRRFVSIDLGIGGLAWMTQLTPWISIGENSNGNSYLFEGSGRRAVGTDNPLFLSPAGELMVEGLEGRRGGMPTLIHGGQDQTHTVVSTNQTTLANGNELTAAASVMQIANTHLLPLLNVNGGNVGLAPGAPTPIQLGSAAAMITTFQSAATSAEGVLFSRRDAELFDANMTALHKLQRAVDKPTMDRGLSAGQVGGRVVGLDISELVTPTPADRVRYGLDRFAGNDTRIQNLANYMMVAEKMIELALVSNFKLQAFNDDPHLAFTDVPGSQDIVNSMGLIFNAFWTHLSSTPDALGTGQTLAEETVLQVTGDTLKTIFNPNAWLDTTQGGMATWVWGAGRLRTGQFGVCNRLAGNFTSWDPATGNPLEGRTAADNQTLAARAALYAVGNDARFIDELAGESGAPGLEVLDVDG